MAKFLAMCQPPPDAEMLDLGGYPYHWGETGIRNPVLCANIDVPSGMEQYAPQFKMVKADATRLDFPDRRFEVVYSNSVIEHLGTWDKQKDFAREARRVGRRLWIQTPARCFPIEPHLIAPLVHYLPISIQRHLLRYGTIWGWITRPSRAQVDAFLAEVRLLTFREMAVLFPDCRILRERCCGFTKSYIAVRV